MNTTRAAGWRMRIFSASSFPCICGMITSVSSTSMRSSAASSYVCPVDDAAESFVVGVVVVADDRDLDVGRVEGPQVAAELQEPGPGLARLDVPIELVFAQVVGGEQVPYALGAGVGGAQPAPRRAAGFLALAADRGPLPAGPWLEAEWPEFIDADHHLRVARAWGHVAVGDGVQVLDPGILRRVLRVFGRLPGL